MLHNQCQYQCAKEPPYKSSLSLEGFVISELIWPERVLMLPGWGGGGDSVSCKLNVLQVNVNLPLLLSMKATRCQRNAKIRAALICLE